MTAQFEYQKQKNKALLEKWCTEQFWTKDNRSVFFNEEATLDFPSAPPGMPQTMDCFDTMLYFDWLERTTKSYSSTSDGIYGTTDPDVFWVIRDVNADVFWGQEPGTFTSRIFSRIEFSNGKINYIKSCWNSLKFLEAAGLHIPLFKMDLNDGRIMGYLAYEADGEPYEQPQLSADPEKVADRILKGLELFTKPDYFTATADFSGYAKDCESVVWFLPPEMRETYTPTEMPYVEAWTLASCHSLNFSPNGRWWKTDEPGLYFAEYMCEGLVDWIGNNTSGAHYRNRYFYLIRFNQYGQIIRTEEVLNPINKFNSIGVSLPTFPYYYR